jgi:hypothetical protein
MAKRKKDNPLKEFFEKHPLVRQRDLAELWGVSSAWISMLATGKREAPGWLPYALGARSTSDDLLARLWHGGQP